jgi:hypothetical protein
MVDRYTRFILTVIAACLVWICVRDVALVRPGQAQPIEVVGSRRTDVNIAEIGGIRVTSIEAGFPAALPVRVRNP